MNNEMLYSADCVFGLGFIVIHSDHSRFFYKLLRAILTLVLQLKNKLVGINKPFAVTDLFKYLG